MNEKVSEHFGSKVTLDYFQLCLLVAGLISTGALFTNGSLRPKQPPEARKLQLTPNITQQQDFNGLSFYIYFIFGCFITCSVKVIHLTYPRDKPVTKTGSGVTI